jgi:hypothetical protein
MWRCARPAAHDRARPRASTTPLGQIEPPIDRPRYPPYVPDRLPPALAVVLAIGALSCSRRRAAPVDPRIRAAETLAPTLPISVEIAAFDLATRVPLGWTCERRDTTRPTGCSSEAWSCGSHRRRAADGRGGPTGRRTHDRGAGPRRLRGYVTHARGGHRPFAEWAFVGWAPDSPKGTRGS